MRQLKNKFIKLKYLLGYMALFILTTASSCDVPTGFIFCPIHVLDSDQELPEPYFRHRDENSKDHTTYFESLVVHDNSTDEIVWQITLDTSLLIIK